MSEGQSKGKIYIRPGARSAASTRHGSGTFSWETFDHEGASVATGKGVFDGRESDLKSSLRKAMEALAEEIEMCSGIIGHIKASAEIKSLTVFSLTEKEADEIPGTECELTADVAAIVYGVSPEELKEKASSVFDRFFTETAAG